MTQDDRPYVPSAGRERRAQRLGFALRSLAAELVEERRKVAELRREVQALRMRLDARDEADGPV